MNEVDKQVADILTQSEAERLLRKILQNVKRLSGVVIVCRWASGKTTISTTYDLPTAVGSLEIAENRLINAALVDDEEDDNG